MTFFIKIFNRLFFSQSDSIVQLAKTKTLQTDDMLQLPEELAPQDDHLGTQVNWNQKPIRILFSLIHVYKSWIYRGYAILSIAFVASLISPNLVYLFLNRLEHIDLPSTLGVNFNSHALLTWLIGLGLALCGMIVGLCMQHYFVHMLAGYQRIGSDLNSALFQKSLRLSLQARAKFQVGDVVNHMSSDSEAVSDVGIIIGDLVWAFLMIIGIVIILFFYIGPAAITAAVVMMILAPLTRFVAKRFVKFEEEMMGFRDQRITLMSQVLNSIRIIKSFSWEKSIAHEVTVVRNKELLARKKLATAEVLSSLSYLAVGTIVLFASLLTYHLLGNQLTAPIVFTCISLFTLLEGPFGELSRYFSRLTQALVSISRIQTYLQAQDRNETALSETLNAKNAFELQNVSFGYDQNVVLKNLSVDIRKGESIAVIGPVGGGKTSFIYGLLQECDLLQGELRSHPENVKKSYVSQEAYILNSSMLENIVFGNHEATKEQLRKAIHAACLEKDIKMLPTGLRTEIGEKGVNLSGGQKQRVSLARAALMNPDLVILDDPLSAVDASTEDQICQRLLFGLWKDKTRIVVTHRLDHLYLFDRVLFIDNGQIQTFAKLDEAVNSSESLRQFLAFHRVQETKHTQEEISADNSASTNTEPETRITVDEEREVGAVKTTVYLDYLMSLGGDAKYKKWILLCLGMVSISAATFPLLQRWWIGSGTKASSLSPLQILLIYAGLGGIVLLANMGNQLTWLYRGIESGRSMHQKMLHALLHSKIRFFDSTPVGRILQRFSRDIESVDVFLQWSVESFIQCVLNVAVSLCLIVVVMPVTFIFIAPCLIVYYFLQKSYRRPAREAKRMDSIARSPRYAHFKETLMGLIVIRTFNKQSWFMNEFYTRLAHSQRMFFGHYMLNRWFSSRVPMIGGAVTLIAVSFVTYSVLSGTLSPAASGLVTIYSLSFWGQLNWGIRIFSDIESRMTSVERLRFYATLETEGNSAHTVAVAADWPQKGSITFEKVAVRYADHLPEVLKEVSFHIPPGNKVGIIGRTGSGKSTIFQAIYRFVELSKGKILIDGQDISLLPLEKLRQSLAIVPQDPTLFLGTIRSNLDRYNEFSDDEIWNALSAVYMADFLRSLPTGLHSTVEENGANLSQGQKQLLCLARALLMKAKIVLLDEATASVDIKTDQLIFDVIQKNMEHATVITIAHRLGTLKDADLVIELEDGKVFSQKHQQPRDMALDNSVLRPSLS